MIFDEDIDRYILRSGRQIYACADILGVDANSERVTFGHDSTLDVDEPALTRDERAEIADEMIRRWTAWRNR